MNPKIGLVALGLLVGCTRSFSQAAPVATLPVGVTCFDGGSPCGSGLCIDGVCCQSACTPAQRCDAPGQLGVCTDRLAGLGCDAGTQCANGICADGVCCASACGGCKACNVPGSIGSCVAVADNTDPHRACADSACTACFGGSCAPALPDTDPDESCGAGETCTVDQRCGITDGGNCTHNNECATGRCIAGACLHLADEVINAPEMNPLADARDVAGVAANPQGDLAVLFTESQDIFTPDNQGGYAVNPVENDVFLALRSPDRPWSAVRLFPYSALDDANLFPAIGRVVFLGRQPLVVTQREPADGSACASGESPCGVFAVSAAATGEVGGFDELDREAVRVGYIDAVVDTSGRLAIVYTDSRGYHVRQRRGFGDWVDLADGVGPPGMNLSSAPAIQAVGTDLYLVYVTTSPGAAVSYVDGGAMSELAVGQGIDCPGFNPSIDRFNDESAKGPARADAIAISAMCNDDPEQDQPGPVLQLVFTPGAASPWTATPIAPGLGSALLSSDGEWAAYVAPDLLSNVRHIGVAWQRANGTWAPPDELAQTLGVASYAISGDGAFPFAAYGIDDQRMSDVSNAPGPPSSPGSQLHAVRISR